MLKIKWSSFFSFYLQPRGNKYLNIFPGLFYIYIYMYIYIHINEYGKIHIHIYDIHTHTYAPYRYMVKKHIEILSKSLTYISKDNVKPSFLSCY